MYLRILQIDLGRQKERIDYIESFVKFAKRYGYNAVLLYLENAVRTPDTEFFNKDRTYSMDEMREIVEIIEREGMDAIPAFENLDHLENFLMYPEFSDIAECKDGKPEGRGFKNCRNGTCGCVSNPRLYELMNKYISDVSSLFHSEYIHMGLDEPFDFCVCDACRARLEAGESKADMFYRHIMKSYELVKSLGKTMMMWDDFFENIDVVERLPRDIIMCNWNYVFVGNTPAGHWTNRKRCDWFRLYDKLGFKYLFCTKAHVTSMCYNTDSFTRYAEKYSPIGAICTEWEKSSGHYLSTYPALAYSGLLWSGADFDKAELYTELLGDRDMAEALLSMNISASYGGFSAIDKACEDDYHIRAMLRPQLEYVLKIFERKPRGDIAEDIYDNLREHYLSLRLQDLGTEVFNIRELGSCDFTAVLRELDEIDAGFREIERSAYRLWDKYRLGIKSSKSVFNENEPDAMKEKYNGIFSNISRIRKTLSEEHERVGILYADLMLHDAYCTVRGGFRIKYEGERELASVSEGIKPSLVNYDAGGAYYLRFKTENKKIDYIFFDVWGEGAIYPMNFRYLHDGRLYVACEAEAVAGLVRNEKNILKNDTQFAEIGLNDGDRHFLDISLSREVHTVRIKFKEL